MPAHGIGALAAFWLDAAWSRPPHRCDIQLAHGHGRGVRMVSGRSASRYFGGVLAFAVLLLPGCRLVPARRVMTDEVRSRLRSPTVVVLLPQSTIGVSIVDCSTQTRM